MPITRYIRTAINRFRKRPDYVRFGGNPLPAPPDPRDYKFAESPLMGGAVPPAHTVSEDLQMSIWLQTHLECGLCALANATFVATGWTCSTRYGYFKSRQLVAQLAQPPIPPERMPDGGTYAAYNMKVAANIGQAAPSVWPIAGDINEVPSAAADANASRRLITYYACRTVDELIAAIASNHTPYIHWACKSDWNWPSLCADGTYEIHTPTVLSGPGGGHFTVLDAYDLNRKMLDGTTGGVRVRNSWGTNWGAGGKAWVSIAYWLGAKGGDANSRYAVTTQQPAPAPIPFPTPTPTIPPLTFDFHGPAQIAAGSVMSVAWTSNADYVLISDVSWNYKNKHLKDGTFLTGVAAGDTWTFTAIRASDGAKITKTVGVTK